MKTPLGVMEIFYGAPWSVADRLSYAPFLQQLGFQFYLYGPKADECLRREWARLPQVTELEFYRLMRAEFVRHGLRFGMALSPQGLYENFDLGQRRKLQEKVKVLSDLGLDYFGLFFDDMRSSPDMAERQLEIVSVVQKATSSPLIFCPSYYCHDSLLDMLFGDRPAQYLETIGSGLDQKVEVLWTGEQIISPEVSARHLQETAQLLQRKPFLCDNFYADDGPINCNFLRLLPPTGRPPQAVQEASHWAFNPMNQAHLSKIVLQAVASHLHHGVDPVQAFFESVLKMCSKPTAQFITHNHINFATEGLDPLSDEARAALSGALAQSVGPVEREILLWLQGQYAVDFIAMIEQSGYAEG